MALSRWLRHNAEHYLLVAAQDRVARQLRRAPTAAAARAAGALLAAGVRAGVPPCCRGRCGTGCCGRCPAVTDRSGPPGPSAAAPDPAVCTCRSVSPREQDLTLKEGRVAHGTDRRVSGSRQGRRDRRLRGQGLRGHPGRTGREGLHPHAHRAVRGLGRAGQHAHGDPHQPEGLRHPPGALRSRLADGLGHPWLPQGRRRGVPGQPAATTSSCRPS